MTHSRSVRSVVDADWPARSRRRPASSPTPAPTGAHAMPMWHPPGPRSASSPTTTDGIPAWRTAITRADEPVVGENGSSFRLYENGRPPRRGPLTYRGVTAQSAVVQISGRVNGTYVYTGEVVNTPASTATQAHHREGHRCAPGTPVLSHDNRDNDGTFTVTGDHLVGHQCHVVPFLPGRRVVSEGTLAAQDAGRPARNPALSPGSHVANTSTESNSQTPRACTSEP